MKKRLLAITILMLLFTGCMSIPSTTTYEFNSATPSSTGNINRTPESGKSDQSPAVSTPQPQAQSLIPSDNASQPSKESSGAEPTVPYNGPVEHIFFHPLMAYPELAFDGDSMAQGYDDWFLTVSEFKIIIEQLYRNNYILIDIHSLYEENSGNDLNDYQPKELMLPKGKKPLVLSIDDLNYYEYMVQNGNVQKLVLNPSGKSLQNRLISKEKK
jgi:hypothetical protein